MIYDAPPVRAGELGIDMDWQLLGHRAGLQIQRRGRLARARIGGMVGKEVVEYLSSCSFKNKNKKKHTHTKKTLSSSVLTKIKKRKECRRGHRTP